MEKRAKQKLGDLGGWDVKKYELHVILVIFKQLNPMKGTIQGF